MNKALLRPIIDFCMQSDTHTLGAKEKSGEGKRERQEDTEDLRAEESIY